MLIRARSARILVASLAAVAVGLLCGTAAAAAPANDAFSVAQPLSGRNDFASGSNVDATKEDGEPDHAGDPGGASIWYAWTAPAAGNATVSTCFTPELNTVLAVYTGASVDALDEVGSDDNGCGDQSLVTFSAVAGTTYRIAVDGVAGATGDVELDLNLAPPNDNFADAEALGGDAGTRSGTTLDATLEDGEPDHFEGVGYPSVWYSWTAPSNGPATFETCSRGFDTVLAAYAGPAIDQLTQVAANDDACGTGSRISFQAVGGTVYSIAVAGFDGATGDFTLAWNRNPPVEPPRLSAPPRVANAAVAGVALVVSDGVWTGTQPISFTYEWGRCDRELARCSLIAGARGRTYVPTDTDIGLRLFARVTATNAAGSAAASSNATGPVTVRAPLNDVVPFVRGSARPGQILVATSGEWSGAGPIALSYRWQSCDAAEVCADLLGEGAPILRVTRAHLGRYLRVVVTATNAGGSVEAESGLTGRVRTAPRCVVPNVKGRPAAAARRALRRAGCTPGRIRLAHSRSVRRGRVISQSLRPGATRAGGARVNLVLSKGRKR